MSTSTLPLQAIDLDGDGRVWYPYHTDVDSATLFLDTPVLPIDTWEWVEVEDDPRPHVDLDLVSVARLLFADHVSPDTVDIDILRCAIVRQLAACRCDANRLRADFAEEYGSHPEHTTWCMTRCLQAVARLTGVGV